MSWAARQRFLVVGVISAVAAAFLVVVLIAVFYKTPSCSDGVRNQGEAGIDCGGPCPYLCSAQESAPIVLFTKAFGNGAGRADLLAYVQNPNAGAAAKAVPYTLALYGAGGVLVRQLSGTLDLPPSSTVPVFVPNVVSGSQKIARAFLSIDPAGVQWYAYAESRALPTYANDAQLGGTTLAPRVTASVRNPSASPLENVRVVLAVRDASGNVIAASSSVIPSVPGQGSASAVFTWNQAFPAAPASFELVPVIALP